MKKMKSAGIVMALVLATGLLSCTKSTVTPDNLYVPTQSDATTKATLDELQQGRELYVNHCGACHGLYSPDGFSASRWGSIMASMAPKTSMSADQTALVLKYVTRGQ